MCLPHHNPPHCLSSSMPQQNSSSITQSGTALCIEQFQTRLQMKCSVGALRSSSPGVTDHPVLRTSSPILDGFSCFVNFPHFLMMYNNKTIIVRDKLWPDDAKLESTQAFTILVGPRHLILCIVHLTFFLIAAKLLFALGSRGLPRE